MDSSRRRSLIILGVVAGVVLALFIVSVAYRPDGDGPAVSSSGRDRWRDRLFPDAPVAPGQLAGCTAALAPFTIQGSCELRIAAADARSRRLVIEVTDLVELRRTMDADGRRIAMKSKLKPGKSEQVFVGKEGETLGLRCLAGLTCRASVR